MSTLSPWLPSTIVRREALRRLADETVAAWSSRWFANDSAALCTITPKAVEGKGAPAAAAWRSPSGSGVAIQCPESSRRKLAGWALDYRFEPGELEQADRAVIEALDKQLLDDLGRSLEAALGIATGDAGASASVSKPLDGEDEVFLRVTDVNGDNILTIAVAMTAIVALCLKSLPPPRPAPPFGKRLAGLGPTPVRMRVTVGEVEIPFAELPRLAAGDVLVLNRSLDDTVEISPVGSRAAFMRGSLTSVDGQAALTLQPCE